MHHDGSLALSPGPLLSDRYKGTTNGVRHALRELRRALSSAGAAEEEVASAEIVVAEALNNVVEHALAEDENPSFLLSAAMVDGGVSIEICDGGLPMPDNKPPIGELPDVAADLVDLPEGGFGWFLIRELARDLSYVREGTENRLTFRLAICL